MTRQADIVMFTAMLDMRDAQTHHRDTTHNWPYDLMGEGNLMAAVVLMPAFVTTQRSLLIAPTIA